MEAGRTALNALVAAGMPPATVADIVFDAIREQQFYIVTHPEWMDIVRLRTTNLLNLENPQDPLPASARMMQSGG